MGSIWLQQYMHTYSFAVICNLAKHDTTCGHVSSHFNITSVCTLDMV